MLGDSPELRSLLEPLVEDLGYELILVELTGGGSRVLRLYIDAPGGVLLEDCEEVSRSVGAYLDVEDPISGNYNLEVSSPGVDRPLVKPGHFQRFTGQRVKIRVAQHHMGRRRFTGLLVEADDAEASEAGIVVDVDGEQYEFAYREIDNARLDPDLG